MTRFISRIWTVTVELVGSKGSFLVRAAVDTGSDGTLMPPEALQAIGCDPTLSTDRTGIFTVSGREELALVRVPEVVALGHRIQNLQVMSHSLPSSSSVNGLLGMDFLLQIPDFQQLDHRFRKFLV